MLQNEKKIELVDKILNSLTFQKATTSSALLRFLLKANLEGTYLKEGIIDIDFFGNKETSDKTTTRVRVSMYNLRKKLDDYYKKEGKDAIWKVVVEKGQYGLSFEKVGQESLIRKLSIWQLLPYTLLIIVAGVLLFQKVPPKQPELWKKFWKNEKTTTLYVGDAFGFKGRTVNGGTGWTRDFEINSLEDYYKMLEKKPEMKEMTTPSNYRYTTLMGVHAAHDLTRLFGEHRSDINIRNASSSSFADIKEGNTIYVGIIKNQNKFVSIFNDANPYFSIRQNDLIFKGHKDLPNRKINCFTAGNESDIAIVSRFPGPDKNELFFFISAHDMGVMATMSYFTNPDSLEAFSKRFLKGNTSFTAVYKAHGHERTDMGLEEIMVVPF